MMMMTMGVVCFRARQCDTREVVCAGGGRRNPMPLQTAVAVADPVPRVAPDGDRSHTIRTDTTRQKAC